MLLLFGDRPGAPHVCSALMSASWVAPDVSGAVALFLSPPFTFFLSALLAAVVAVVVVAPHLTGSLRDAIVTIDPPPLLSSLLFSCLAWLPPLVRTAGATSSLLLLLLTSSSASHNCGQKGPFLPAKWRGGNF